MKNKVAPEPAVESSQATSSTVIALVRQEELVRYIGLKNQITRLTADKDELETSLKDLLGSGAKVEDGTHIAELKFSERRTPSWKEEFIALGDKLKGVGQGETLAEKVLENTDPKTIVSLVVK
jgi:hypothetical protein